LTRDGTAEHKRRWKMAMTWREDLVTGTSGPTDADGDGPYRATQVSGESIERAREDCEEIEIMCKSSPVRATMRRL
jgi:hypothetical protein